MLRISLPVHVERKLNEGTKPLFAPFQLFFGPPQLRDVLEDTKLTQRSARFVPGHVTLAVNYSMSAIGADHPVFNVIAWPVGLQGSRRGGGGPGPIFGMNEI